MKNLNFDKLSALSTAEMLLSRKYGNLGSPQRTEFDAASRDWYNHQCSPAKSHVMSVPQTQMAMA